MSSDLTSHSGPDTSEDPVAVAALDWFVRLREVPLAESEVQAFARWRDADPAHAAAYAEVAGLWVGLEALDPPKPQPHLWRGQKARRRRWLWPAALAASLALAVAAPRLWIAASADATTGTGEVRRLTLADGTRVALDGDSAIAVSIDAGARQVRLLRGRAWFDVAHEARHFTVAVGQGQVRDIGTAFEVTRRGDGGEVVVTQGLVELTADHGRAVRLAAGQAARFDGQGRARAVAAPPAPIAWTQGRLQFVSAPLREVLDDLARHGAGEPVLLDEALGRRRVTGAVNLSDPAAARDTVLARVGAQARRIGPWVLVTRR